MQQCPDKCTSNSKTLWTVLHFMPREIQVVKHNQPSIGLHCLWHLTPQSLGKSCCETVTQGFVTLWSEPAVSIFRRQNKREKSVCLRFSLASSSSSPLPHHSLLVPPPAHTIHLPSSALALSLPSPLLSPTLPFHHTLHPA